MAELELAVAIDMVALHVMAKAVAEHASLMWEDYPEIGEADWDRVVARVTEIARPPQARSFEEAYRLLTDRAAG